MSFFEAINYAASHEDGRSELRALALETASRVLCITGSGSRALDLLVARPREVVALDMNPVQTHLLALKLSAMQALSYDAYVSFLGMTPARDRRAQYGRLRARLPAGARLFWDRRQRAIARGVLYCGRWERFLRVMVAPAAWARRRLIDRVFSCASVAEQEALWLREWNTPNWRRYLACLANRWIWSELVREPGMRHIPRGLDIVSVIQQRFDRAAGSFLFRNSPWAWLVFHGRLNPEGPLPPHLERAHFADLAERAGSVTPVTDSLLAYLSRGNVGRFSAFSLSDFGSYADDASYRSSWQAVARAAEPGARICERQFLVPRDPASLPGVKLARDAALEGELAREDNSVVYELIAGKLTS